MLSGNKFFKKSIPFVREGLPSVPITRVIPHHELQRTPFKMSEVTLDLRLLWTVKHSPTYPDEEFACHHDVAMIHADSNRDFLVSSNFLFHDLVYGSVFRFVAA
jgi:hypothetical protein